MLSDAHQVFDSLPVRDVVSWTALISGYARLADSKHALALFGRMITDGTLPDSVTFSVVLTLCSHASLVTEGEMCFDGIASICGLAPTLEHCACLVELFSRTGQFDKAVAVIEGAMATSSVSASSVSTLASAASVSASAASAPAPAPAPALALAPAASVSTASASALGRQLDMWVALLGGCGRWANLELGRWAFEQSLPLNDTHAATYVYMSNIYAAAGMREQSDLCTVGHSS
jgi:pentatricopeptide repeat protein